MSFYLNLFQNVSKITKIIKKKVFEIAKISVAVRNYRRLFLPANSHVNIERSNTVQAYRLLSNIVVSIT